MRIFVTGATGYVGAAAVSDMQLAGHKVIGLARSEESEAQLQRIGADALRGDLDDFDSLRRGVERSDAVAHLAFNQDLSQLVKNGTIESAAIATIGHALAGSDKPFVTSSGCGLILNGQLLTEDIKRPTDEGLFRRSEQATLDLLKVGVKAMIVRLPQVNGPKNRGFVPLLINLARSKGYAAYVGDGSNRWPAGHRDDVAQVYRLAIEKGKAGQIYHAVAEEGYLMRDLVGVIGDRLGVPVRSITLAEANDYFGNLTMFAVMDSPVSSAFTRAELGWKPSGPTTFEDLKNEDYFG